MEKALERTGRRSREGKGQCKLRQRKAREEKGEENNNEGRKLLNEGR